jgi:hypothetical protein
MLSTSQPDWDSYLDLTIYKSAMCDESVSYITGKQRDEPEPLMVNKVSLENP